MTRRAKPAPHACGDCRYATPIEAEPGRMVCRRNPPAVAVIDNKPVTMRVAVGADELACGEHVAR